MLPNEQEVHLFFDKIRGLVKFVAYPRPPFDEYKESMQVFVDDVTKDSKSIVGQMMTPAHIGITISMARRAIANAYQRTGYKITFYSHIVDPQSFDDAEYGTCPKGDTDVTNSFSIVDAVKAASERANLALRMEQASDSLPLLWEEERSELLRLLGEVVDDVASCDMRSDIRERIEKRIGRKGKAW
jgi:hypothetical protein